MTAARPLVLIVDDEPQILRFLVHALSASGHDTLTAATAAQAETQVATRRPDLVILDLGLPDADGKTVIEAIRAWSDVPIIVLSARDQEMEKIMSLDLGADDFVGKPFAIGELLARIRVCLRPRREGEPSTRFRLGPLEIDAAEHRVLRDREPVHLTPKEFELLLALAETPGRVLTHRQLLTRIWGPAHADDVPYLRVFVGQLRQKIEFNPGSPELILTEPGIGYRAFAAR
ncbi:response regulator [Paragemmobacter straminiformis]|uniref:Response regulator n=1 Tax=Paragemmobacter straminiformis TaxID=2045119 RepID=A0A842IDG8_9RHOB|nr:response regulator [Gemmobacter straminiformis]MBC2837645.1 response regulator [Gemmobacter straminiformis]